MADLSGMFSNLRQASMPYQRTPAQPVPTDPQQQTALQAAGVTNPMLQMFGRGLGGMLGTEMRSPQAVAQEQARQVYSQALAADPQKQLELAGQLVNIAGYEKAALELAQQAKANLEEAAKKTQQEQARKANINRAKAFGVPQETIDSYAVGGITEEAFTNRVNEYADKKSAAQLNKANDTRQISAQRAYAESRGAPAPILAKIEAGDYVGQTELLQDTLKGKTENESIKNTTWLDQSTGDYITYPTSDGKILTLENGKEVWKWPQEVNSALVQAPVRQATGQSAFSGKLTQGQATVTGAAVNVTNQMIDLMDGKSAGERFTALGLAGAGIPTDEANLVNQYNTLIPDVRGRIVSGAALKKDEEARYDKLFGISAIEAINPVGIARKLRITSILNDVDSKLATGEMTPQGARDALDNALAFDFSPEEKAQLERGQFKAVLSKYQAGGTTDSRVQETVDFFKNLAR